MKKEISYLETIKMIDEILADCSAKELKSIAEVIKTTKSVLKDK